MKQVYITQHVGRSKSVVSRWIRKKSTRYSSGRKNQTTTREYRILNRIVSNNRLSNAAEISQEWNISGVETSRSTAFRRLQEMEYRSRVPACKTLLTKKTASEAPQLGQGACRLDCGVVEGSLLE